MNEVESYMNQKGVEYRTIDKSRSRRIYERLKAHIALPKRTIQVLGTNGKGSTGRFLALMLMQNGASVLHFTSPHIFSFSERFYKNGAIVGDGELLEAHNFLQGFDFMAECSYFEYATFLACVLAQGVDYLILEAGVGGELDSTSVIPRELCVFSVIDYDHTEILGESIEEIATTKLNAVFYPNKVPKMVLGVQKYEIVEKIAKEIARTNNVEFYSVESFDNLSLGIHSRYFGDKISLDERPSSILLISRQNNAKQHRKYFDCDSPCESNTNQTQNCNISSLRGRIVDSHEAIQNFCDSKNSNNKSARSATLKALSGAGVGVVREGEGIDLAIRKNLRIQAPTPSLKKNARRQKGEFNADLSAESRKKIDSNLLLDSRDLDSSLTAFAQNDESFVDCFGNSSESPRNDGVEKYLQKHHLADFLKPNLNLALKALEILGFSCNLDSLPKLDLRGRFEQIAPNIIIDVGHNQNAAFAIRQNLGQKKVILVYNSYFQKNISEILGILKDNILRVEILRVADNPRIIEQKSLEQTLESLGILYQNFSGIDSMDSQNDYLIFGSFSVVEAFMRDYYNKANQK